MKGIDIEIIQDETGLLIRNLEQSKGVEFRYVKFNGKRKSVDNAETLGSVILSEQDFIKLSEYFNERVLVEKEEKQKDELATVKFFEERDKKATKTTKAKGKK